MTHRTCHYQHIFPESQPFSVAITSIRVPWRLGGQLLTFFILGLLFSGCAASLKETHYLAAFDPATKVRNYFRIRFKGITWLSKAKFSTGDYDRVAVQRLFGENQLSREHLATEVDVFDPETGKRRADISAQLAQAESGHVAARQRDLDHINQAIAREIGRFRARIVAQPDVLERFEPAVNEAMRAKQEGENFLAQSPADLTRAAARFSKAVAIMAMIRLIVDGEVIVRFFDGAGNEIDVRNKALVIFVATDASRFTESIRQLAEAEDATQDLMLAVMGPRLQEAQAVANEKADSNQREAILAAQLDALIQEASAKKISLSDAVLKAATKTAGKVGAFRNADEIRGFIQGLGATE